MIWNGWTRQITALLGARVVMRRRSRREVNRDGWTAYARSWGSMRAHGKIPDLDPSRAMDLEYLGDEWSLMEDDTFSYGVDPRSVETFGEYLRTRLVEPHLTGHDLRIMEIGPGGGRLTSLLLPHARQIYAVDISAAMLDHLRARFSNEPRIVPILTDGTNVDGVEPASLDAAISFDTFVHLEPWDIFRYLEITHGLLRTGGIGIIHFSDVETPIGFKLFCAQVPAVVHGGLDCGTFSVMSKSIMREFLLKLGFEVVSISNSAFPRDAVAVFRKPVPSA